MDCRSCAGGCTGVRFAICAAVGTLNRFKTLSRWRCDPVRASLNSEGGMMALVGIVVTFVGFLVAAGSVGLSSSNTVRLVIVLAGIAISLGGIMGLINPAYQKNAVWKR